MLGTHGITKDATKFTNSATDVAQDGWYYEMQELSYSYRLTDFQAALGTSQLARANEGLARPREIAARYDTAFANTKVTAPLSYQGNAHHLYVTQTNDRLGLYNHLKTQNIFAQVHYVPVHLMPYYAQFGHKKGDYPLAEVYYDKCLSLPMYPALSNEEQDFVIATILNYTLEMCILSTHSSLNQSSQTTYSPILNMAV